MHPFADTIVGAVRGFCSVPVHGETHHFSFMLLGNDEMMGGECGGVAHHLFRGHFAFARDRVVLCLFQTVCLEQTRCDPCRPLVTQCSHPGTPRTTVHHFLW